MKKLTGSKNRMLFGIIVLFAIFSITGSCKKANYTSDMGNGNGSGGSGGPGPYEVWIQGMAFNPSTITVSAGTTIIWINKDAVAHTVTSNTGVFDSGSVSFNGTYSRLFSTVGTFPYHCTIHPSMTATVIVN